MIKYDLVAFIAARKRGRLSQEDIAKLAEVTEKTIAHFENGQRPRSAWGHRVIKAYQSLGLDGPGSPSRRCRSQIEDIDDDDIEDSPSVQKGKANNGGWVKKPQLQISFDSDRLRAQVRAFVADKDLSIHESGRSGARHIMVPPDDFYEFGRILLLAAGIHVG